MIILDTNLVSEVMRPTPSPRVVAWIGDSERRAQATTAVTLAETMAGLELLPDGRRRAALVRLAEEVFASFDERILPFDEAAARQYGRMVAVRQAAGRPIGTPDAQIAAICRVHGATLATRNVKDFDGLDLAVVNPWEG